MLATSPSKPLPDDILELLLALLMLQMSLQESWVNESVHNKHKGNQTLFRGIVTPF
jgi:hypothetical protein